MRIVSLDPGATEIVCALGLTDDLVGVDAASDWPPDVDGLPRIALGRGSELQVDEAGLRELDPNLVIAGGGEVRTSRGRRLAEAVAGMDEEATLLTIDPVSLEGVFNAVASIGAMCEAEDEALGLIEILRERLGSFEQLQVRRREAGRRAPRVVALDCLDPLRAAGRWVPEQIRRAGGWDVLGRERGASTPTSWSALVDLDPHVILVVPNGLHLAGAEAAWTAAPRPPEADELSAIRGDRVFAVDAAAYVERAGPRLVDGIGLLGEIFDPEAFVDTSPPLSWTPIFS